MSTFNRRKITSLCLRQLSKTKPKGAKIQCWDARSTEYTTQDLYEWGADEVYKSLSQVNDGQNRAIQLTHFINKEHDQLIYLVDNDAFHAAGWHKQLMRLWNKHKRITTLFNAGEHRSFSEEGEAVFKKMCGGISMLLSREVISKNKYDHLTSSYDWTIPKWWDFVVCSKESFVAHLDFLGLHSLKSKTGVCLGVNPNKYLVDMSQTIKDIMKIDLDNLQNYEEKINSQHGEDGVISRIFDVIGATNQLAVEIGAGVKENNTIALNSKGWNTIRFDGKGGTGICKEWFTRDNINTIMDKYYIPSEFDLFSLDIDGNDYYILERFDRLPRVIVLEYNNSIPINESKTIVYNERHSWDGTNYYGASLKAFVDLLSKRGYKLVYIESSTTNAFFVNGKDAEKFHNAGDIKKLWRRPVFSHKKASRTMIDLHDA